MIKSLGALVAAAVLGAVPAAAQSYPSKTITIVVPASPGGVVDTLGRQMAQRLTEKWGQQVVVENRPGANNSIAAEYVSKSAPDGHTLFVAPDGTFVANPSLYPKLPYDPDKSFTPITGLVLINHALILHPSVTANSVKDLIDAAKQKPST
jgi:tripartite-type tricarboxylate transporter receptor subunit TctC